MMPSSPVYSQPKLFPLAGMVVAALALYALLSAFGVSTAHGAAAGSVAPTPGSRSRLVLPPKSVDTRKMRQPGLLSASPAKLDMVHLLFPQDGAIFPNNSTVTLGWLPPGEEVLADTVRNAPESYDIEITREDGVFMNVRMPSYGEHRSFSGMVTPPGPGKYQWQIISIMPGGQRISSQNRVFTVLQ